MSRAAMIFESGIPLLLLLVPHPARTAAAAPMTRTVRERRAADISGEKLHRPQVAIGASVPHFRAPKRRGAGGKLHRPQVAIGASVPHFRAPKRRGGGRPAAPSRASLTLQGQVN